MTISLFKIAFTTFCRKLQTFYTNNQFLGKKHTNLVKLRGKIGTIPWLVTKFHDLWPIVHAPVLFPGFLLFTWAVTLYGATLMLCPTDLFVQLLCIKYRSTIFTQGRVQSYHILCSAWHCSTRGVFGEAWCMWWWTRVDVIVTRRGLGDQSSVTTSRDKALRQHRPGHSGRRDHQEQAGLREASGQICKQVFIKSIASPPSAPHATHLQLFPMHS